MNEKTTNWKRILIGIALALIIIDLVVVNAFTFLLLNKSSVPTTSQEREFVSPTPFQSDTSLSSSPSAEVELSMPMFDSTLIQTATLSLTSRVNQLEKKLATQNVSTSPITTGTAKEFYIPLGTGSTDSTGWTSLPGVEAYVAPGNYGKITAMYFEAGLHAQNGDGRVYARLLNVTDNVGLVESEVYREGSSPGLVSSGKIPIPSQTKLFRVQMKSALGSQVILDNARIKLFVE